ncbi:schlafen-like protein 1 [Thunnus thynnus]|uniref:schlafen-like protein 1 n=1 Tax=Thunnus thynnus TaxID=8237 RepID=UPI0035274A9D
MRNPDTLSDVGTSASLTPSTSAHVRTVSSGAKKKKRKRAGRSRGWKLLGWRWGRFKWVQKKRCSGCSSPHPQSTQRQKSNSAAQNQTGQQGTPVQSTNEQDITCCQWLYHGAHIINDSCNIEFMAGRGNYMQNGFFRHVAMYGSAFLNSGGGRLVVGVNEDGVVYGLSFSHEEEHETRLQVDVTLKRLQPPVLPRNYSLHFLPVVKSGVKASRLKVLCLTFRAPSAFSEPTLYQTEHGDVFIWRDGNTEGPLSNSVILEWSRQKWSQKKQELEHRLKEAGSELSSLTAQADWLLQFIITLQAEQSQAHNSRAPDVALESPLRPGHEQM